MARHGGGHHGGAGGLDQINLDAPHVGTITALTLVAFAVGLVIMPFKYAGAFLRVLFVAAIFLVPYTWIITNLGEENLFDHPLLCLPLIIAGMWVADAMRAKDDARRVQKIARHEAARKARMDAMRRARMSTQKGPRK